MEEVEERQSIIIKKFDDDTRKAKVLTPLVCMGEIIPWFPAVYFAELQDALISDLRVVILTPTRYEPLTQRFPCSWRILIKDHYHLSMIAHRHIRLSDDWRRYPKPENWSECAQILIKELKPLLERIVQGMTIGVFMTDVHTYSPALPTHVWHWAVNHYQTKVDPNNSVNWLPFTPTEEMLQSFPYNWEQHKRPFVAIHTHAGIQDRQKYWPYWNAFLETMEKKFEGTVFRLGGMDDLIVKLEPQDNFVDMGWTHNSVAPLISQMAQMDYFVGAVGGMMYLALSQKVPSLAFFDNHTRNTYSDPHIGYDGADLMKGWGTSQLDYFLSDNFSEFGPDEIFKKFCDLREKYH